MSIAAVAAAGVAAAGTVAASALSGGSGSGGSAGSSTMINDMAPWVKRYGKGFLERQYNLSNQPYRQYPGLLNMLADEGAAKHVAGDFFGASAFVPSQEVPNQNVFRSDAETPYSALTARPGESLPLPLSSPNYSRYLETLQKDPGLQPVIVNQAGYNALAKQNGALFKQMKDRVFVLPENEYQEYLNQGNNGQAGFNRSYGAAPMAGAAKSPLFDQYFAPAKMKNLGFLG